MDRTNVLIDELRRNVGQQAAQLNQQADRTAQLERTDSRTGAIVSGHDTKQRPPKESSLRILAKNLIMLFAVYIAVEYSQVNIAASNLRALVHCNGQAFDYEQKWCSIRCRGMSCDERDVRSQDEFLPNLRGPPSRMSLSPFLPSESHDTAQHPR